MGNLRHCCKTWPIILKTILPRNHDCKAIGGTGPHIPLLPAQVTSNTSLTEGDRLGMPRRTRPAETRNKEVATHPSTNHCNTTAFAEYAASCRQHHSTRLLRNEHHTEYRLLGRHTCTRPGTESCSRMTPLQHKSPDGHSSRNGCDGEDPQPQLRRLHEHCSTLLNPTHPGSVVSLCERKTPIVSNIQHLGMSANRGKALL